MAGLAPAKVGFVTEQPLEDVVTLAYVGRRWRRLARGGSDEQVDAGAPGLLPLAELVELGARRDQHLAGPVADLGEEERGGLAADSAFTLMRMSHEL